VSVSRKKKDIDEIVADAERSLQMKKSGGSSPDNYRSERDTMNMTP